MGRYWGSHIHYGTLAQGERSSMDSFTFAIISVGASVAIIIVPTTVNIFHFTVSIIWASRAVALATIILAGRIVTSASTRRREGATTRRAITSAWSTLTAATTAAWFITARIESPRRRGRGASPLYHTVRDIHHPDIFSYAYLDLQDVIATKALVVHLMIGIICITTALVFHECKEPAGSTPRRWNVAPYQASIASTSQIDSITIAGGCWLTAQIHRLDHGLLSHGQNQ